MTRRSQSVLWATALREAGALLALAALLTAGWWARNPQRLALSADPTHYELELEAPLFSVADAVAAYDDGIQLFVDTRAGVIAETIPGALFIAEATFDDDLTENFDFLLPEDSLILFGDGNLTRVSNIAGRLKVRGYENLRILKGGLSAWKASGGAISTRGRRGN